MLLVASKHLPDFIGTSWVRRSTRRRRTSTASSILQLNHALILIAVLCMLMSGMSLVVCSACLQACVSFRDENDYLTGVIRKNLSNILFLNKFRFMRDEQTDALVGVLPSLDTFVGSGRAIASVWFAFVCRARAIKGRVLECAQALALATTSLFDEDEPI